MEALRNLVLEKEVPEYLDLLVHLYNEGSIHTEKYSPIYQHSKNLESKEYVTITEISKGARFSWLRGTGSDRERVLVSITNNGRKIVEDAIKETAGPA
jgi:hypothetical protein